jgi:hypothetical protein
MSNVHVDMTKAEYFKHILEEFEVIQTVYLAHESEMRGGDPVPACRYEMISSIYGLLYEKWKDSVARETD